MREHAVVNILTQVCEDRDFSEWHQGCPWCTVWVVLTDTPLLQMTVQVTRNVLKDLLLPRYLRQPHITIAYRGLTSGNAVQHPAAEFTAQQLQADVATLQTCKLQPFFIHIQGASSFATVPYLAIQKDEGRHRLHQLQRSLSSTVDDQSEQDYTPHITLGHYAQSVKMTTVQTMLHKTLAHQPAVELLVERLHLVRYDTRDIAGPLVTEGFFDLRNQCYQAQPTAILRMPGMRCG